jgi:hypothetical protein
MTATAAPSSRERLGRLLELAAGGADARAALLDQLADLLFDWPADYAQAMRAPFEALFEKTAREADAATRAVLAARLADHAELPVALLNEFFLDAAEPMRADILRRNDARDDAMPQPLRADAAGLVAAARRTMNGAFAEIFASALSLPSPMARAILRDGQAAAIACRSAGLDRAAYSAIALLTGSDPACLAQYDDIPQAGAERLVEFWRTRI